MKTNYTLPGQPSRFQPLAGVIWSGQQPNTDLPQSNNRTLSLV